MLGRMAEFPARVRKLPETWSLPAPEAAMSAGRPPRNPREALAELAELKAWLASALVAAGYDNPHQFLARNRQFDKKVYDVRNGTRRIDLAVMKALAAALEPPATGSRAALVLGQARDGAERADARRHGSPAVFVGNAAAARAGCAVPAPGGSGSGAIAAIPAPRHRVTVPAAHLRAPASPRLVVAAAGGRRAWGSHRRHGAGRRASGSRGPLPP